MNLRTVLTGTTVALTTGLLAGSLNAAFVVQPTDVEASSEFGDTESFDRTAIHAINGSGLSDDSIVETNDPVPSSWPTDGTNVSGALWHTDSGDANGWIRFDLGEEVPISGIHVWNYNGNDTSARGIQNVDVRFSSDSISGPFSNTQSLTFAEAPQTTTYEGEQIDLASPVTARFVEFDIQSNYGDSDFSGLSEVRFTAVPEPASLALLGAGGLMLIGRRRRA